MRQIRYNLSSNSLRFEYPVEWNPADISAITLTILDTDANELLAATGLTLFTDTSLDGEVKKYASSFTLDSATDSLSIGDVIMLSGIEGNEVHTVKAFNSTTKVVEVESILQNDYADNDPVYGCFGDVTVDTTTTTTFTTGLELTLLWTPTGGGIPTREAAQISKTALEVEGLRRRFQYKYPRAYNALTDPTDRLGEVIKEAELEVQAELENNMIDIQRIVNQDAISLVIMAKAAVIWLLDGDEDKEDERNHLLQDYEKKIGWLINPSLWVDDDQDNIKDTEENTDHQPLWVRSW